MPGGRRMGNYGTRESFSFIQHKTLLVFFVVFLILCWYWVLMCHNSLPRSLVQFHQTECFGPACYAISPMECTSHQKLSWAGRRMSNVLCNIMPLCVKLFNMWGHRGLGLLPSIPVFLHTRMPSTWGIIVYIKQCWFSFLCWYWVLMCHNSLLRLLVQYQHA